MFKKFKDRLAEVGEEVKKDPRFVNSLASVNQLAQQTYSAISKTEQGGSRESLPSQFPPGEIPGSDLDNGTSGHRRTFSDQYLQTLTDFSGHHSNSKESDNSKGMSVANNSFFSLTEEDDHVTSSPALSPVKEAELPRGASPGPRSRRLSSGSMVSEAANLFPIYESSPQLFSVPSSDLDSTAGSEWENDDYSSSHLSAVTKEQLYQMLQKTRTRYHKYKGRYADVIKAYTDLQNENAKVKNVMQQTQDKALRRISELREQCQLEQSAKRHLEEELRSDMEEKEHIIKALQTKVSLLKNGRSDSTSKSDENMDGTLVDLSDGSSQDGSIVKSDSEKVSALEDKVKRLEALLTKCKESIKANKQKTIALTEVKESLATQLASKESECQELQSKFGTVQSELNVLKTKEQEEELQMAESKMMMHQEIIHKDEEIGGLRTSLKRATEDAIKLKEEMEALKKAQEILENEKSSLLTDVTKGQAVAIKSVRDEYDQKMEELKRGHQVNKTEMKTQFEEELKKKQQAMEKDKQRELQLKEVETQKRLEEKDEEGRLAREELELRVKALTSSDDNKTKLLRDLESRLQSLTSDSSKVNELADILKSKETEVQSLRQAQDSMEAQNNSLDAEVSKLREELKVAHELESEQSGAIAKLKQDVEESLSKCEELRHQMDELTKDKNETIEKIKSEYEANLKDIQKQVESEQNNNTTELQKNFEIQISSLKEDHKTLIAKFTKKLKETKKAEQELTSSVNEKSEALAQIQSESDELTSKLDHLTAQLTEKEICLSKGQKESEMLSKRAEELSNQLQEKEDSLSKLREEHQSSLKEFQVQLQSAGNDVTAQLQRNFEAQLSSLIQNHQADVEKFSENIRQLEETISAEGAERKHLTEKLEEAKSFSATKIDEMEKAKSELSKERDKVRDLESKSKGLRNNVELLEDQLDAKTAALEATVEKVSKLELEVEHRSEEVSNLLIEVESLRKFLSDSEKKVAENEKELLSMKDRERSQKELEQQMIAYQKDLQEQIRSGEIKEANLLKSIEDLERDLDIRSREVEALAEQKSLEIAALKADLEMKIRLEREKETSFKEHQVQSIEYQKKLQEQLQEAGQKLENLIASQNQIKIFHDKEMETATKRLEQLSADTAVIVLEKENLLEQVETLNLELANNQILLASTIEKLEESDRRREEAEKSANEFKSEMAGKESQLAGLQSEVQALQVELQNRFEQNNLAESQEIVNLKVKCDQLWERNGILERLEAQLRDQLVELKTENAKCNETIDELKTKFANLETLSMQKEDAKEQLLFELHEKISDDDEKLKRERDNFAEALHKISDLESAREFYLKESEAREEEFKLELVQVQESLRSELELQRQHLQDEISRLEEGRAEAASKASQLEDLIQSKEEESAAREEDLTMQLSESRELLEELRNSVQNKEADLLDLGLRLQDALELTEGLKRELKNSQSDKESQLLEFEESLVALEKQVSDLKKKNDEVTEENGRLARKANDSAAILSNQKSAEDEQESRLKSVLRECEKRLLEMQQDHENEIETLRQKSRDEIDSVIKDFRTQIAELKQELYEKTSIYDEMVERHQRELAAKQQELDQEVEACNRMYQTRLAEYEAAQEAKWTDLEKNENSQNSWHWERQQDPRKEIFQRTPTREHLVRSPATLPVTSNQNQVQTCQHTHSIEEATEYEYLKNILYQYMLGKEPMTLSKVLSAVIKFTPEQTREVVIREEHKQSLLASLGFKPL